MSEKIVWAAVRKDDKGEWIDSETVSVLQETAYAKAQITNERIPRWAKDNKIIRIARFELKEVI